MLNRFPVAKIIKNANVKVNAFQINVYVNPGVHLITLNVTQIQIVLINNLFNFLYFNKIIKLLNFSRNFHSTPANI